MKIAIVTDTVLEPRSSVDWKKLCEANKLEYREFDSYDPRFIDELLEYNPQRTLWRSGNSPPKKFKDEAQRQFLDRAGLRIVPNWKTHYLYDHKIRQSYLFRYHNIPHPKTWIFFKESYASDFVENAEYPFVVKADSGAGSKSFVFVGSKEKARELVHGTFKKKGKWAGREYESKVLYVQEYIPIKGVWRIGMFKDNVAYGYFAKVKPGTKKASGQGLIDYTALVPQEVFSMAMRINRRMGWDWMLYDIIWSTKYKKYLILEITDTCGHHGNSERKLTHYRKGDVWIPKEERTPIQELVFRLFVLEDMQRYEAPGC